jgi:nicotinamide phosphoribosyltransferase
MQSLQRLLKRRLAEAIKNRDFEAIVDMEPLLIKALEKPHNLILLSDAYKYSHHKIYAKGTTKIYSYLESRGGKFDETVFYGLQIFIKEYLQGMTFTMEDIDEAEWYLTQVFGKEGVFDRTKWEYILNEHGGKLPIKIKAVPEGISVPVKNVLMTVENTDDNCSWLTNFLESILLQIWYPITVATLSREVKKVVMKAFNDTCDLPAETIEFIAEFVLNDFGFRGVSSVQSARNGGSAHLVNFCGSDNVYAGKAPVEFYNSDKIYVASIPATEHSVMTQEGEEGECNVMKRVLQVFPTGPVACVSDSYNIFRACGQYWGEELKELILSRPSEPGNQLVVRPDSGDPKRTLLEVFNILFDKFGFTVNTKGFRVLPPQIRVIQGDGVNLNSIIEILAMLVEEKISMENLVFGMGGKLLQADINRDTQNFAFKACFAVINGKETNLIKHPTEIDADGNIIRSFKNSKSGRMKLIKTADSYRTITSKEAGFEEAEDVMVTVFENGVITQEWSFEEVRAKAKVPVIASVLV